MVLLYRGKFGNFCHASFLSHHAGGHALPHDRHFVMRHNLSWRDTHICYLSAPSGHKKARDSGSQATRHSVFQSARRPVGLDVVLVDQQVVLDTEPPPAEPTLGVPKLLAAEPAVLQARPRRERPVQVQLAVTPVAEYVVGHGAYRLRLIAATTLSAYRTVAALRWPLPAAKLVPC